MKILQKLAFTVSAIAITFSVLFTILHVEGVRELYIIAAAAFFFGSLAEYRSLRNLIGLVCGVLLFSGLILKTLHLAGANELIMFGMVVMALAYIPVAIWRKRN